MALAREMTSANNSKRPIGPKIGVLVAVLGILGAIAGLIASQQNGRPSPAEEFGFRGPVKLGLGLLLAGVTPHDFVWRVPRPGPVTAKLELITDLSTSRCEFFPADLPCPPPKRAALRFYVSALLDYRTPVTVAGRLRSTYIRRGKGEREVVLDLGLQRLQSGRHCLLVSVVEDATYVVRGQYGNGSGATLFPILVGASSRDHCRAPTATKGVEPWDLPSDIGCRGEPVMSTSPQELILRRRPPPGTRLWAQISGCSGETVVAFVRDGRLQGPDDLIPPFSVPTTRQKPHFQLALPPLPPGGWHEVAIQETPIGPESLVSHPVLATD